MVKTREQRRQWLYGLISQMAETRAEGVQWAADMLHVSVHTIDAWLKPETSKSSKEIPLWAVELMEFKMAARGKLPDQHS